MRGRRAHLSPSETIEKSLAVFFSFFFKAQSNIVFHTESYMCLGYTLLGARSLPLGGPHCVRGRRQERWGAALDPGLWFGWVFPPPSPFLFRSMYLSVHLLLEHVITTEKKLTYIKKYIYILEIISWYCPQPAVWQAGTEESSTTWSCSLQSCF